MRDKFPIGVSEGERVFAGVGGSVGGFCVESFTLSEMGYKLLNGSDKFTIYGIDGYLEKEEGLPTRSEFFSLDTTLQSSVKSFTNLSLNTYIDCLHLVLETRIDTSHDVRKIQVGKET